MADDQGPKIASIDELVNELTKKNSPPPPAPPKPQMSSQFQTNPSPAPKITPPPPTGGPARPMAGQARPTPAPAPMPAPASRFPAAPSTAPVKEYQSSIRTMKEDISTLKQGQKPAGVDVPRIIQPPAPPSAPAVLKPPLPAGGPGQQFKMPSVNLGEAQKTGPLPQAKEERPSPSPTPVPQKPQIFAPPPPAGGTGGRNRLFILIGGAVVLFGALYWFLVLRVLEPEIVLETPTPTLSPIATPILTLEDVFGGDSGLLKEVSIPDTGNITALYANMSQPNSGEFRKIYASNLVNLSLISLFDRFSIAYPIALAGIVSADSLNMVYGQKEIFDSKGVIKLDAPVEKRLVFVSEVKDSYSTTQTLLGWETTMVGDLQKLLALTVSKQKNPQFSDNAYLGSAIRYRNFIWPDKSIDYAIITATNGKSYLVLAGSREAMYATMDKLKGF